MQACETGGQWGRAIEILQQMRKTGLEPSVSNCEAAISTCGSDARMVGVDELLSLVSEMRKRGIAPSTGVLSTAIRACEKGYKPDRALEHLGEMKQSGYRPITMTYDAAISVCLLKFSHESKSFFL